MRILITGGAGFIGSHTSYEIFKQGHQTIILDNLSTVTSSNIDYLQRHNIQFELADCRDIETVRNIFHKYYPINAVIHFAGYKSVAESMEKPLRYYNNNLVSIITILQVMLENEVHRFIFSSSATVYGTPKTLPINEDEPCVPENVYGRTKYFAEEIIKDVVNANKDFKAVILRYFNPIGSYPCLKEKPNKVPENLMPYIVQVLEGKREKVNIFGDDYPTPDGTGVRDYIHIEDLVRGHICAINVIDDLPEENRCKIFNLGTGKGYSVLELIRAMEKVSDSKIPWEICDRRQGDVVKLVASCEKAKLELHWSAKRDLIEMCRDSLPSENDVIKELEF
jgi:UDP-glucose 4-epimerase